MASRRSCVTRADSFCYVCGSYIMKDKVKTISSLVKLAYHQYFGMKIGDQDKTWAPHVICILCNCNLTQWLKGKGKMSFAIPMVWWEPKDHTTDCYFCLTNVIGISTKHRNAIQYPNLPSAIRPVPHGDDLPVLNPPQNFHELLDQSEDSDEGATSHLTKRIRSCHTWSSWCHLNDNNFKF